MLRHFIVRKTFQRSINNASWNQVLPTRNTIISINQYHCGRVFLSSKGDEVPSASVPSSPTVPSQISFAAAETSQQHNNSGNNREGGNKFWEGAYNGVKSYIRYTIPLLLLFAGYHTVKLPTPDPEWFGFKMKQKRKPKYVLKVQPFEETLSSYSMALTEAREPVDNLDGPEWKKALKLKQIRQQMGSYISSNLIQSLTDDQLLQLEAIGKMYAQSIAEVENERVTLAQEHITLLIEESNAAAQQQTPTKESEDTSSGSPVENGTSALLEKQMDVDRQLFETLFRKYSLEHSFFLAIKDILTEHQWKFLTQKPLNSALIMLKNYFVGVDMHDISYPTGIDIFVHKITHFPIFPSRKAPKVFVIKFDGDIMATQVEKLREEITGIITMTRNNQPPLQPTSPPVAVVDSKLNQTIRSLDARKVEVASEIDSVSTAVIPKSTELPTTEALALSTTIAAEATQPQSPSPSPFSPHAAPRDRVVLVLKSGGGTVTGYGLAAAQLSRIKAAGLDLTVCVDEVAASGGYLMASVADEIYASPFAILGSIGVVANSWNITERLEREGVYVEDITAGKYKRTMVPYKKPNNADRQIVQEELNRVLTAFKNHLKLHRPEMNVDALATGETWYGPDALKLGLVDKLSTSDDVILSLRSEGAEIYNVEAVLNSSMRAAGILGEILNPDNMDNKSGGEESSGWLNQLMMIAMRCLVKSAMEHIDLGSVGIPSSPADIGSGSHNQVHRAASSNSGPLLSDSRPKAMLVMSDRSGKM